VAIWPFGVFVASRVVLLRHCVASRVVACCVLRHVAPTEPKCGAFVIHRDLQFIEDIHGHEPATDEPATDEPATSLSQVRGLGYPLSTWHLPRCHLPTEVLGRCHCHHVANATEWQHLA